MLRHIALALTLSSVPALAFDGPTVQQYLPDYSCSRLVISQQQAMDPRGSGVFIRRAPSASAPTDTAAPSILFVKVPRHQVDGFVEVLQINNRVGWIDAAYIGSQSKVSQCRPALMSNGRIGAAP